MFVCGIGCVKGQQVVGGYGYLIVVQIDILWVVFLCGDVKVGDGQLVLC